MTFVVREYRVEDAAAVAEVVRATQPFRAVTGEKIRREEAEAHPAERRRAFVAQNADGRVAGAVRAGLAYDVSEPGVAVVRLGVLPAERGRGIGTALLTEAEGHLAGLGAAKLLVWAIDDGASPGFAERRGYRRGRGATVQRLDLTAALPPVPVSLPPGVELLSGTDFADDPRPLYEADVEALADEPSDAIADAVSYDTWLAGTWRIPGADHRLTTVVVADGEIAALVVAETDGAARYWSAWTGTRRDHRGRGFARLAKAESLRRARAVGCTEAFTSNDGENAAMLAVNTGLGYRPCARTWRYIRELGG